MTADPAKGTSAPKGGAAAISLRLSGAARIALGATQRIFEPKDALLLGWLAVEGPTARSRLAALLFPESDEAGARNNLRQRLFQLKKKLGVDVVAGDAVLEVDRGVTVEPDGDGEWLSGADAAALDELGEWLAAQRARRRLLRAQWLAAAAEQAETEGELAAALEHANALVQLQPESEHAHRHVMRLHYLRGDRAAALAAFARCEKELRDKLGATPSAETLALLAGIESQRTEPAFRPRVLPVGLQRPPRIVGREAELEELTGAWSASVPFLVLGDAGIGKTRLLDTLVQHWPGTVLVQARPGDIDVPLVLVARLVDALCQARPAWAGAGCVLAIRELLSVTAEVPLHANRRPAPRRCAELLHELLVHGVEATPRLALLLDDLQFADEASVAVLDKVLSSLALDRMRWGWASRTHGEHALRRIETLRRRSDLRLVALRPLNREGITELVEALQLGAAAAPEFGATLLQRVGGNPIFLLEALRSLYERGCPLEASQIRVPLRVHDLVETRLADLTPGQRLLMRVAAVAGTDFNVAMAEAVSGRDLLELTDDWRVLERLALFDANGIAHDLYAEAALAGLPQAIAKALHARVAERLEAASFDPARLAAHWLAADQEQRARPHLLAAARKAWRTACAEEVLSFFRHAAQIAIREGKSDEAFEHWFDAADAISEIGSTAMLQSCADALEALAQTAGQRIRLRLTLAVIQYQLGESAVANRSFSALLSDAIAAGDVRVEVECRFAIAARAAADGAFGESLQQLTAAQRLALELGDGRRANAIASSVSMVLALRGQPQRAIADQRRLLPLLEAEGDLATWAVACSNIGLQQVYSGDTDNAVREAERAIASAQRTSIAPPDLQLVLRNVTETLCWAGRFDLALSASQTLAAILVRQGGAAGGVEAIGMLYLQLGRPDLAQQPLSTYLAVPRERPRDQLRRALVGASMACWSTSGSTHAAWPADALISEDLALACRWALLSGLAAQPPWSADEVAAVAERCDAAGLTLFGVPLRALQARRLLEAGKRDSGTALARSMEADQAALAGGDLVACTPWAALYLAQALQRADCDDAAHRAAASGAAWVERIARDVMPAEFRDSFVRRHPVNRELLRLAARKRAA